MYHRLRWLIIGLLSLLLLNPIIAAAQSTSPADALRSLNEHLDKAQVAVASGDFTLATAELEAFHTGWVAVEDAVRGQNITAYSAIEAALGKAELALESRDATSSSAAIHALDEASDAYIASSSASTGSATPADTLRLLNAHLDKAEVAIASGDTALAKTELEAFHTGWVKIEDAVREQHVGAYAAIEGALGEAEVALAGSDAGAMSAAIHKLDEASDAYIESAASGSTTTPSTLTLADTLPLLQEANDALAKNDTATALTELQEFQRAWPLVESVVKGRSPEIYESTETDLPRAMGAATRGDLASAREIVTRLQANLTPLTATARYGIFDATVILLREGLEAILIIGALLAFLRRSGNEDKRGWVLGGGLLGVAASLITALLVALVFRSISAGSNRELIEGITGLVAAAMLFSVSFWLHGKSHLGAWQSYIRNQTTAALATGSLFSLGLLAFLAVFREGAETALFFVGIASSISTADLALGIVIAIVLLALAAFLFMRIGARLPLRPFFLVTSALIFYLGFKFIGTGIHSLQAAQVLPANISSILPEVPLFGIFPTWETTVPQLIILGIAAILILLRPRLRRSSAATT